MLVLAASPAAAISRYNPLTMNCAGVRAAIHNQGAVIFRYQSPRGLPLYDRYVRNSNDCEATDLRSGPMSRQRTIHAARF
ncbi:hypothetical protein REMIM1_CH01591 [Rhizobium etli bv. mimosae str. Mim1]|nr:hypothetical protein REMIM1_CH01591 [Rhizobium etli bv. mimosae str. Mim1]